MKIKAKKIGVIGKKCGMTRIFTDDGISIPVTVVEVQPNRISQVKTIETDGYSAVQVTTGNKKRTRVTKPEAGHFAKAGVEPGRIVKEFPVATPEELEGLSAGGELKVDMFQEGQMIDATGTSIGKGFSGVIKVHHFKSQDATHGNSLTTRAPGSIGQRQSPGRVFKGKRMARQLGNVQVTIQNQKIVKIDSERNLLMIKGSIPGAPGSYLVIRPAVKFSERGL